MTQVDNCDFFFVNFWWLCHIRISLYHLRSCWHRVLVWWMTWAAIIPVRGKQQVLQEIIGRYSEGEKEKVMCITHWLTTWFAYSSKLARLRTAVRKKKKRSHQYLNSWSYNQLDRPFVSANYRAELEAMGTILPLLTFFISQVCISTK